MIGNRASCPRAPARPRAAPGLASSGLQGHLLRHWTRPEGSNHQQLPYVGHPLTRQASSVSEPSPTVAAIAVASASCACAELSNTHPKKRGNLKTADHTESREVQISPSLRFTLGPLGPGMKGTRILLQLSYFRCVSDLSPAK